jgi:hypothetical protein
MNDRNIKKRMTVRIRRLTFLYNTSCKRITSKASSTATYWIVIHNLTASIKTACAWTGIQTLLVDTCSILWALRTNNALWSTRRWISNKTRKAGTHSMLIHRPTLTVWSTRRWITWILRRFSHNYTKARNTEKIAYMRHSTARDYRHSKHKHSSNFILEKIKSILQVIIICFKLTCK